jgi:two-component system chemotaxis response regulator CheY
MPAKRVLSLGQCGADHWSISTLLQRHFDAEVVNADTFADATAQLRNGAFDLVLVNRVLDRNGASGVDFVAQMKADDALAQVPVMLVSNHRDAQRDAVARGALPGFGKAALDDAATLDKLHAVLGA